MLALLTTLSASALTLNADYQPGALLADAPLTLPAEEITLTVEAPITEEAMQRGRRQYITGAVTYGIGAGGLTVGGLMLWGGIALFRNSDPENLGEALAIGFLGAIAVGLGGSTCVLSLPLMSTGAMLTRRGATTLGGDVTPLWGRLALGLTGATAATLVAALSTEQPGLYIASGVFALGAVGSATRQVVLSSSAWSSAQQLSLRPTISRDELGLAIVTRW